MPGFTIKILFILFLINNLSFGQVNKLLRIEIETEEKVFPYNLIPLQDSGMLLFYKTVNNATGSEVNWYFAFYDVNMQKVFSKEIPVNEKLAFVKDYMCKDNLFLFFQDDSKKSRVNNYSIISIDVKTKNHQLINGIFHDQGDIDNFQVLRNKAFMNFKSGNEYATILKRDLLSDKTEDLFYNDRSILEIEKMIIDTANGSLYMVLKKSIAKKQYGLFYYEIDMDGSLKDSLMIKPHSEDKQLNKAMIFVNNENEIIIIGTYINDKSKTSRPEDDANNESSGIFFTEIIANVQQSIKFYGYLDFKNFSVYLSDIDFIKYKRKAEKREKKGKDFSINYRLLVHDIIRYDNQYIFTAEAYYPEYHTVSYMTYDYYGRPVPQYYSVFDGYRYTNALIASFNSNGDVIWSNVFDMYKIISFSLKKRINCFFDTEDIILSYTENGQIVSQIVHSDDLVGEPDYTNIKTLYSNDQITEDKRSEMEYWYDNYFIIYGYQTIKNNYLSGKRKRTVFYVNKIAFQ